MLARNKISINRLKRRALIFLFAATAVFCSLSYGDALDERSQSDHFLSPLIAGLGEVGIDIAFNLNDREFARSRPDNPRLGGFSDLPSGSFPDSEEISHWEADFSQQLIAGVVIMHCGRCKVGYSTDQFKQQWFNTESAGRIFITYAQADGARLGELEMLLSSDQYAIMSFTNVEDLAIVAELYATSGRRLAFDTSTARKLDSEVTEINYLGKRARRNTDSIFRQSDNERGLGVARNEPAVFLKESLGDEYTQSTIEEIVVPGGVAFGESARLDDFSVSQIQFDGSALLLMDEQGTARRLEITSLSTAKALFDFVQRSEQIQSDAIVDIDGEGRVRLSAALRDTDVGYEIMHADTLPFNYVRNLAVTKSVIIDTASVWRADSELNLGFEAEFEVRFLSADNMRIAQTRVALVYEIDSVDNDAVYRDSWGRDVRRLNEKMDYAGLGNSLRSVSVYAAWTSLFRAMSEQDIPFLKGRYEFMKIEKTGRRTPSRY